MAVNSKVSLSALDLLGLAEQRKVARIDLSETGYGGIIYVCDLTAAQLQLALAPKKGSKMRYFKDDSREIDLSAMVDDAGAKFLEFCLVTDKNGGKTLDAAFEAVGEDETYIIIPESELIYQFDVMVNELKVPRLAREKLEKFPNAIISRVVKTVKEISGMAEDRVEEKKEN